MLPPLPRRSDWVPRLLSSPAVSTFPARVSGSVCIDIFEACLAFTHVAACTLALSP
jgi:hypothetical protein